MPHPELKTCVHDSNSREWICGVCFVKWEEWHLDVDKHNEMVRIQDPASVAGLGGEDIT